MIARFLPFLYAVIASVGAVAGAILLGHDELQQSLYAVRWTARIGLPLVLIIYTMGAFHRMWPSAFTRHLVTNRRSWGLSFAITHTIHLLAIFYYLAQPESVDPGPLGIIGFSMIYLMAFSSNSGSMKRLGKYWKRIHTAGVHVIWMYYLVAYSQMLFEPELRIVGAVVVPLLVGALIVRLMAWSKKPGRLSTLKPV